MKVYLACSLTESNDREIVQEIVKYLEGEGHQVLDEHVAHENHRARFMENTGITLSGKSSEEIELIIRDTDLQWVRQAEVFIGLLFSVSAGASIEYEHRRLLLELQRQGLLRKQLVSSELFLCIFLKEQKRSALLHAKGDMINREYVDNKEDALEVVKKHMRFF